MPGGLVLRGERNPTEQMESLQRGYIHAVAAAAGCIVGNLESDDGLDALLKHRSQHHNGSRDKFLQVQLKATHQIGPNPANGRVGAVFKNERFDLFAEPDPEVHKIVVIMILPTDVDDWLIASHQDMRIHHCAYWTNIAGMKATGQEKTVVNAPTDQMFDDRALCAIMQRIGQGGAP